VGKAQETNSLSGSAAPMRWKSGRSRATSAIIHASRVVSIDRPRVLVFFARQAAPDTNMVDKESSEPDLWIAI
jgi:hypothetical protein